MSLGIERGEMVALIGASGSGKSTLIHHLAGLAEADWQPLDADPEELNFGIIPQVLPLWISFSLYRFESNVLSATVLGIVDAGGIGMILWEYIRGFWYAEISAVPIVIVGSVSLLDMDSQRFRKMFI